MSLRTQVIFPIALVAGLAGCAERVPVEPPGDAPTAVLPG